MSSSGRSTRGSAAISQTKRRTPINSVDNPPAERSNGALDRPYDARSARSCRVTTDRTNTDDNAPSGTTQ